MPPIFEINVGKQINLLTDLVVFLACVKNIVCEMTSLLHVKKLFLFFQLSGFLYMMIDLWTIRENEVTVYHAKT